jgi:hypothetical protein
MSKKVIFLAAAILVFNSNIIFAETGVGPFITSGHVEAFYYPTHNEYDPNPMIPFKDRITARYGLDFESTLAFQKFPKIFGFVHSFSAFGDTRPQTSYNYRADPIVMILDAGAGYKITPHTQIRITTSRHIDLGKYQGERLLWSGVSLRAEW